MPTAVFTKYYSIVTNRGSQFPAPRTRKTGRMGTRKTLRPASGLLNMDRQGESRLSWPIPGRWCLTSSIPRRKPRKPACWKPSAPAWESWRLLRYRRWPASRLHTESCIVQSRICSMSIERFRYSVMASIWSSVTREKSAHPRIFRSSVMSYVIWSRTMNFPMVDRCPSCSILAVD